MPRLPPINSAITRRQFTRSLALPVGALVLGIATRPASAVSKKKKPSLVDPAGPNSAKIKFETKVLWDFGGCLAERFTERVSACVHKGNAYLWVLLPGYKTMIVKVPLDGGEAQMCPLMPGHVTGKDPHRYYSIGADAAGYIHVSGDMHQSPIVQHWVSKKPEDISEFVDTSHLGDNKRPQGLRVTYPIFFRSPDGVLYHSIRCALPVWGLAISVLDVKTQTWTMLGAEVPAAALPGKKAKDARGKPLTAWEHNGELGDFSYTQPRADICWDKNKRMHLAFTLLNESPAARHGHTQTHLLYAYSDDGGKTLCRGNGSKIQLPMRAEAGPHQADVVYAEHEGPPPWLEVFAFVRIDDKNRPVVSCNSHKTGHREFVLENRKWTELGKNTSSPAKAQTAASEDEDVDPKELDLSKFGLPYEPNSVNKEYLQETGNLVYTVVSDRYKRIRLVQSKPLKEKE